jgi:hypothetical protein
MKMPWVCRSRLVGPRQVHMNGKIDCANITINDGIICMPGGAFHLFTFCKPGSNLEDYVFTSIKGTVASDDITSRVDCNSQLSVHRNCGPSDLDQHLSGYTRTVQLILNL